MRHSLGYPLNVTFKVLLSTLLLVTTLWSGAANAHETRPAIADLTVGSETLSIEMRINAEALLAGIDLSQYSDTNDAPEATAYDALRLLSGEQLEEALRAGWDDIEAAILVPDASALSLDTVEVVGRDDIELPRDTRIVVSATLAAGDGPITIAFEPRFGKTVVRLGEDDEGYAAFLDAGEVSAPLPRDAQVDESAFDAFVRFVIEGIRHIIPLGIDHILFVLGLFFFSLAWRPLLTQVSAFTLAHTITLALATLGVVKIPDTSMWLVEALIAISITYVAIENILRPKLGWWRTAVVFGFGLLHGLGFASVLGDLGLNQGQFVLSLVAFNIGVEIGQLSVILVAFVLLALPFGKTAHYRRFIVIPGSLGIAAVGFYWFIERAFL